MTYKTSYRLSIIAFDPTRKIYPTDWQQGLRRELDAARKRDRPDLQYVSFVGGIGSLWQVSLFPESARPLFSPHKRVVGPHIDNMTAAVNQTPILPEMGNTVLRWTVVAHQPHNVLCVFVGTAALPTTKRDRRALDRARDCKIHLFYDRADTCIPKGEDAKQRDISGNIRIYFV